MNERLYSITNRDTGFTSEAFPLATGFISERGNDEADRLRAALHLVEGSDDYFTVGILAAVRAFPVYGELLPEKGSAADMSRYVRPSTTHEGGQLVADPTGPPRVTRVCQVWPPTFRVDLEYLADDAATLRYDGGSETIACRMMTAQKIEPTWPESSGIRGRVELTNNWTTGNRYRINDYPVRFPYAATAEMLRNNSDAQAILQSSELAGAFYGARSAVEKVALVAIALGRSNRNVYPD